MDLQAVMEEHGGVPAIEGDLMREGVVRVIAKRWVKTAIVTVEGGPSADRCGAPVVRFSISDEDHKELHSFGILWETAKDVLQLAHPGHAGHRTHGAGFAALPVSDRVVREGDRQYLTASMVTLDCSPTTNVSDGAGVRFEVSDRHEQPLYSFTVDWPLAFLVVNAVDPLRG